MATVETIDDVIDALTAIIDQARAEESRLGYFPALYRRVTIAVKDGIDRGRFEDGPRMARLDVIFAKRYIDAYTDWRAGGTVSHCWALAFGAAGRTDRAILQHLLLGMNAHINLDLAIAASETAPGEGVEALQKDFFEINQILFEQVNGVQTAIGTVAPLMWLLDWVGGRNEEKFVEFSLTKARDAAWMQAKGLAKLSGLEKAAAIDITDIGITAVGKRVLDPPGWFLRAALAFIVRWEVPDVRRIIDALR